jgi:hypothetical protein
MENIKIKSKIAICFLFTVFIVVSPVCAQISGQSPRIYSIFDSMLFDSSMGELEKAIKESSRRHAIYSFNVANATTPEFRPILLPGDQAEMLRIAPPGVAKTYFNKVLLEHQTSKLAMNRSRQVAFYALYKKKIDNYRQIVSLGKK